MSQGKKKNKPVETKPKEEADDDTGFSNEPIPKEEMKEILEIVKRDYDSSKWIPVLDHAHRTTAGNLLSEMMDLHNPSPADTITTLPNQHTVWRSWNHPETTVATKRLRKELDVPEELRAENMFGSAAELRHFKKASADLDFEREKWRGGWDGSAPVALTKMLETRGAERGEYSCWMIFKQGFFFGFGLGAVFMLLRIPRRLFRSQYGARGPATMPPISRLMKTASTDAVVLQPNNWRLSTYPHPYAMLASKFLQAFRAASSLALAIATFSTIRC
jgi:hypothetical protein